MKIGIYGGTFDPIHRGHITAAQAAAQQLGLDLLLLIPASIPPHKDLPAGSATAEQRLEMTRMAGDGLINVEHPSGSIDVSLSNTHGQPENIRASVIRTARKILSGMVYLPD